GGLGVPQDRRGASQVALAARGEPPARAEAGARPPRRAAGGSPIASPRTPRARAPAVVARGGPGRGRPSQVPRRPWHARSSERTHLAAPSRRSRLSLGPARLSPPLSRPALDGAR